jgi:hypothetical protein
MNEWSSSTNDLGLLCTFLEDAHNDGLLGFYTELLRDAPEPLFQGVFQFVVGNPPWVNWEYLPPNYRDMVQDEWPRLGLYGLKGLSHAFSKEDISSLVTYVACHRYLSSAGKLAFVLPQALFQSSLNAKGFRNFRIGTGGAYLCVLQVDDLVAINPFEGVVNRTSVLFLEKGRQTVYPVRYRKWHFSRETKQCQMFKWSDFKQNVVIEEQVAAPTDSADIASYWLAGPAEMMGLLDRLEGSCPYRARTGMFTGGANGVFYLEAIEHYSNGTTKVRNITERAKRIVRPIEALVESDHLYPLLRGRNVDEWRYCVDALVLCAHTPETKMRAIAPSELQATMPLTYEYLEKFRSVLGERRGFGTWEQAFVNQAFYVVQRIGGYTFAPYKVVWRYICKDFRCCVIEPQSVNAVNKKPVIPHEKLMLIGLHDRQEAYYVCGVLTSAPVRLFVESRMVETQIAPHVIQRLALPPFDPGNDIHIQIASVCEAGHLARASGNELAFSEALRHVDTLICHILNVTGEEAVAARKVVQKE